MCVDTRQADPLVTIIDFGICTRTDEPEDLGYLALLVEKLFSGAKVVPSLEKWLDCDDIDTLTLGGLSEALREQLSLDEVLPRDAEEESASDEVSEAASDQQSLENWLASDVDESITSGEISALDQNTNE